MDIPAERMMANWEQIRASSFSLIFRPMGRLKMFSFFSCTSSSRVITATVSRRRLAASNSS